MWPGGINIKILFEKRIKFITRSYYIHSLLKHVKGGGQNGLELLARGGRQAPPAVPGCFFVGPLVWWCPLVWCGPLVWWWCPDGSGIGNMHLPSEEH